jgi:uncharacterized HAD superfamily protein
MDSQLTSNNNQIEQMIDGLNYQYLNNQENNNQHRKIMLDLDATLYPLMTAMNRFPGGEKCLIENCHSWDQLTDLCGGEQQMFTLFQQAMKIETMRSVGLFPGAIAATNNLRKHGFEIHLVTHRHPDYSQDTFDYLNEQNLAFDHFVCDYQVDKLNYCKQQQIHLLVDDHPQLLQEASKQGLTAMTLLWPYNKTAVNNHQISHGSDWLELVKAIHNHSSQNKGY